MFEKLASPKRILLIEPPFYRIFGYKRWHYPLGLTLVGTYLEDLGHQVRIFDADKPTPDCKEYNRSEAGENYHRYLEVLEDVDHYAWKEANPIIAEFKPDIIGISASISAKIDSANLIAKNIKNVYGNKVITVLGGVHVNSMLIMYPDYNFGEYYDEVCAYIPNIFDRKPNKQLLIDFEKYDPKNFCTVWTSKGCPKYCTFCCNSLNREIVFRNTENIRKELNEIRNDYGTSLPIYFIDENFLAYTKRFYEITDILKELGMKFKVSGCIMDLTAEKIERFIEDGGLRMYIGIESGSQRILDRIKKQLKIEEIIKRASWLNEAGVPWSAFFIVGFPFEELDDLKLTEELIYKIHPTSVYINRFTPYPGTEIFKEYFMNTEIKFRDLFQMNRRNSIVKASKQIEHYIDYMFNIADDYNRANKVEEDEVSL